MRLFRNLIHVEPNLPPLYKEGHEEWKGYDVTYQDVEKQVAGSYSRTDHPPQIMSMVQITWTVVA